MTFKQEIEALIATLFYAYYKRYVEPLEQSHDELLEENRILKRKLKDKSNTDYRELARKMKKERDVWKSRCLERK